MNGNNHSKIYFLNVGISKEHIEKTIPILEIKNVVLFSSIQLEEEMKQYKNHLENKGVNVLDVVFTDPFTEKSINEMVQKMLILFDNYSNENIEIIGGLTGGTNLMAISLGLVAFLKNLKCNYILNTDDDFIIEIDTFEKFNSKMTLEEIEQGFKGQKNE